MQQDEQQPDRAPRLGEVIPPPNAYARSYRIRGTTVVELRGEIDLGSEARIEPHLAAAVFWPAPLRVVLDLGPLEFIDCYGLSLLVRARRRVVGSGGALGMVCDRPQTWKLLRLTGLHELFRPARTLDEALRDCPER